MWEHLEHKIHCVEINEKQKLGISQQKTKQEERTVSHLWNDTAGD